MDPNQGPGGPAGIDADEDLPQYPRVTLRPALRIPRPVARHLMHHEDTAVCVRKHWALVLPAAGFAVAVTLAAWAVNAAAYYHAQVPRPVGVAYLALSAGLALWLALRLGREHVIVIAVIIWAGLNAVAYAAVSGSVACIAALWILTVIAWLWALVRILAWRSWWFVLTGSRIIDVRSFPRVHVEPMPLQRLGDLRYDQTVPGRFLGYATLECASFATDHALRVVRFLPHSEMLEREIWAMKIPAGTQAPLTRRLLDAVDGEQDQPDRAWW